MEAFQEAFNRLAGYEWGHRPDGGYTNDPLDPGGETKFGISKRAHPNEDIRNLTIDRAREIYKRDYWDVLGLDDVEGNVAGEIFEQAVNMGPGNAVKNLQAAMNAFGEALVVDGAFGPFTRSVLRKWTDRDPEALLLALNGEQYLYYKSLRRELRSRFMRGWIKRTRI